MSVKTRKTPTSKKQYLNFLSPYIDDKETYKLFEASNKALKDFYLETNVEYNYKNETITRNRYTVFFKPKDLTNLLKVLKTSKVISAFLASEAKKFFDVKKLKQEWGFGIGIDRDEAEKIKFIKLSYTSSDYETITFSDDKVVNQETYEQVDSKQAYKDFEVFLRENSIYLDRCLKLSGIKQNNSYQKLFFVLPTILVTSITPDPAYALKVKKNDEVTFYVQFRAE